MQTTLRKISEHAPCQDGLRKLLRKLGKKKADDEPVSIVQTSVEPHEDDPEAEADGVARIDAWIEEFVG